MKALPQANRKVDGRPLECLPNVAELQRIADIGFATFNEVAIVHRLSHLNQIWQVVEANAAEEIKKMNF